MNDNLHCNDRKRLYDKIVSNGWESLTNQEISYVLYLVKQTKFINNILQIVRNKNEQLE